MSNLNNLPINETQPKIIGYVFIAVDDEDEIILYYPVDQGQILYNICKFLNSADDKELNQCFIATLLSDNNSILQDISNFAPYQALILDKKEKIFTPDSYDNITDTEELENAKNTSIHLNEIRFSYYKHEEKEEDLIANITHNCTAESIQKQYEIQKENIPDKLKKIQQGTISDMARMLDEKQETISDTKRMLDEATSDTKRMLDEIQLYNQNQTIGYAIISDMPGEPTLYYPVDKEKELQVYIQGRTKEYLKELYIVVLCDNKFIKYVEALRYYLKPEEIDKLGYHNNLLNHQTSLIEILTPAGTKEYQLEGNVDNSIFSENQIIFKFHKSSDRMYTHCADHSCTAEFIQQQYNKQNRFFNRHWQRAKDIWQDNPWLQTTTKVACITIAVIGTIALAVTGLLLGYKLLKSRDLIPESFDPKVRDIASTAITNPLAKVGHELGIIKNKGNFLQSL